MMRAALSVEVAQADAVADGMDCGSNRWLGGAGIQRGLHGGRIAGRSPIGRWLSRSARC